MWRRAVGLVRGPRRGKLATDFACSRAAGGAVASQDAVVRCRWDEAAPRRTSAAGQGWRRNGDSEPLTFGGELDSSKRQRRDVPNADLAANNLVLRTHSHNDNLDAMAAHFDAMPRHDIISFSTVVKAFARSGRLQRAADYLERLIASDVGPPNAILVGGLLASVAQLPPDESAEARLVQLIVLSGFRADSDDSGYRRLGDEMRHMRSVGARERYAELMQSIGVAPNPIVLAMLIDASAKAGDVERAEHYFAQFAACSLRPVLPAYTALVACCLRGERYERCLELERQLRRDGLAMTSALYTMTIVAAGHLQRPERIRALLDEFIRSLDAIDDDGDHDHDHHDHDTIDTDTDADTTIGADTTTGTVDDWQRRPAGLRPDRRQQQQQQQPWNPDDVGAGQHHGRHASSGAEYRNGRQQPPASVEYAHAVFSAALSSAARCGDYTGLRRYLSDMERRGVVVTARTVLSLAGVLAGRQPADLAANGRSLLHAIGGGRLLDARQLQRPLTDVQARALERVIAELPQQPPASR